MTIALILIAIGLVFFAKALGYLDAETISVLWPLLLVVLGLSLLGHRVFGHDCRGKNCWCNTPSMWGSGGKKRTK